MKYIGLIVLICIGIACNESRKTNKSQSNEDNDIYAYDSMQVEYISPNLFDTLKTSSYWFKTWDWNVKDLSVRDFSLMSEKDFDYSWLQYSEMDFIDNYSELLIPSPNRSYYIDMYSYNTIIEPFGDSMLVEFGVDTKINIINKLKGIIAEIVSTGSYEVVEDCIWINDNQFLVLGYVEDEGIVPFLWYIDIKERRRAFLKYNEDFRGKRDKYFFKKFPQARINDTF